MTLTDYVEKSGDLFALPRSVTQLKDCIDDESASIEDVAAIVATDPALTSKLLSIANSAMYRFPNKIETISRALQVIGTGATYNLALAYGVSDAMSGLPDNVIDLDEFWMQSVVCGLLAKQIAEFHKHRESERFFVTGLLHNIGALSIAIVEPEKAKACLQYSAHITPAKLQKQVLQFTYADLSAELIRSWHLPDTISEPLNFMHASTELDISRDAQILRLAYLLMLEAINSDIYPPAHLVEEAMYQRLDMEIDDVEIALGNTMASSLSIKSIFFNSDI